MREREREIFESWPWNRHAWGELHALFTWISGPSPFYFFLLPSNIISLNLTQLKKSEKSRHQKLEERERERCSVGWHSCMFHSHSMPSFLFSLFPFIHSFQTNLIISLTFFWLLCSFLEGRNHHYHHNFHCIVPKFLASVLSIPLSVWNRNG